MNGSKRLTNEIYKQIHSGDLLDRDDLLDRGWSRDEIRQRLPAPDRYQDPYLPGFVFRLWKRSTVEDLECKIDMRRLF